MMKNLIRIFILVTIALFALTGCSVAPDFGPGLVIGQSYRLVDGETLNEDLTIVGGNANLEEGSVVNGDVAVIGGNVTVDGEINGDLSVMGGFVYLDDNARIEGSVETLGGTVQRSEEAVVKNQDTGNAEGPLRITAVNSPALNVSFEPVTATLMAIFQAFALAALAIVINLFAPHPMERAGQAGVAQAAASGGVGCLTILVLLVMAITLILLPVSALGLMVAGAAVLYGWTALGLLLGRRLSVLLNQTWSDPVNAGVGTLTLTLLTSLLNIIPCIGWLASFIVGLIALGAVVLTRFGTQVYPPAPLARAPLFSDAPDMRVSEARAPQSIDFPKPEPPAPPEGEGDNTGK